VNTDETPCFDRVEPVLSLHYLKYGVPGVAFFSTLLSGLPDVDAAGRLRCQPALPRLRPPTAGVPGYAPRRWRHAAAPRSFTMRNLTTRLRAENYAPLGYLRLRPTLPLHALRGCSFSVVWLSVLFLLFFSVRRERTDGPGRHGLFFAVFVQWTAGTYLRT